MAKVFKFVPAENQYDNWLKENPILHQYSDEQIKQLDDDLRLEINKEVGADYMSDIKEYMLFHKWKEVNQFIHSRTKEELKEIEQVKDMLWKPIGRGDYRRIMPELVLTSETVDIEHTDFFGNKTIHQTPRDRKLIRHWNILRILISSSRHDGTIGRQLRYLVRDKVTKTYLGVICISSAMRDLTDRNNLLFGTTKEEVRKNFNRAFAINGRSRNMTNGQTIQSCQPFGRSFNGGKLLTLMCISKQVQDDWKKVYGDVLVTVETTSLYGEKDSTQYEGLKPFWNKVGMTSGETPLKPSDELWKLMKRWSKKRYPRTYFRYIYERNEKGMFFVRNKKNQMIDWIYRELGVKAESNHKRGVYLCKLYENADEFLQHKIDEKELKPTFNNSVEHLVEFWKFGFKGDTKDKPPHPEILKHATNSKIRHANKNSPAKVRLQSWIDKQNEKGESPYIEVTTDWYQELATIDFETVKERYKEKVAR